MAASGKIMVPIGLAQAVANHRGYTRVMATFCYLKALDNSGRFVQWRKSLTSMAEFCHISARTLETRISEMKLAGLVKSDGADLLLASWDFVWAKFEIQQPTKQYWYYEHHKITSRPEYLFHLLAIREVQRKMRKAYELKLRDRIGYRDELQTVLGATRPVTAQEHLAGILRAFIHPTLDEYDIHTLRQMNPDDQVSVRYMRKMFGYSEKSASGPSYRKRKLAEAGMIEIEKRVYHSQERPRIANSGTVHYSRRTKRTFLRLCDRITPAL